MVSIYSPEVKAVATRDGITELQAYRKLKDLRHIRTEQKPYYDWRRRM